MSHAVASSSSKSSTVKDTKELEAVVLSWPRSVDFITVVSVNLWSQECLTAYYWMPENEA